MGRIRQVAWLQPRDMGEPRWKHTWIPKSKFIWERKGKERKRKTKERKKRKGDPALSGKVKILEKRECVKMRKRPVYGKWQPISHLFWRFKSLKTPVSVAVSLSSFLQMFSLLLCRLPKATSFRITRLMTHEAPYLSSVPPAATRSIFCIFI